MAQEYAYLFEAKGIQRYIFDSGPLRDLVGASDLVAGLASSGDPDPSGLLQQALSALDLQGSIGFSRCAGGSFCAHSDDVLSLQRLRGLWRLAVGLRCPGLELSDAGPVAGDGPIEALRNAYDAGGAVRENTAAELPPAGHPLAAFNPRTGRLMTARYKHGQDLVPVDVVSGAHRARAQELQHSRDPDSVARRFLARLTHEDDKPFVFPRNLERDEEDTFANPAFPFLKEDQRIAVVHADLSGLGQIFQRATQAATRRQTMLQLAMAIERAIEAAARAATKELLLPKAMPWPSTSARQHIIPARPVVLGGDDITILVRADLALPFAQRLLIDIEQQSASSLAELSRHLGSEAAALKLPERLSACAGIAVVKAGQPFLMANELAESLCSFAKRSAKFTMSGAERKPPYPALLAFHNAQSTLQQHYQTILGQEMTAPGGIRLTANPYLVGRSDSETASCEYDRLLALARALDGVPQGRGKLLEAARFLFEDKQAAQESWKRWREVLSSEQEGRDALADIDRLLAPGGQEPELEQAIGVISDALELIDCGTDFAPPAVIVSEKSGSAS